MNDTPSDRGDVPAERDPSRIRYVIGRASVVGPAFASGTEVALRLFGTVVSDRIVSDEGVAAPIMRFAIGDWEGPYLEQDLPPGDPIDAALEVLAQYVTLPYGGLARTDARNRNIMRRVIDAYDAARAAQ